MDEAVDELCELDPPFLSRALPEAALPPHASSAVSLTLERALESAYDELCRQLAFHLAGDHISFDVPRGHFYGLLRSTP